MIWKEGTGAKPWRCRLRINGVDTLRSFPTKKLADQYERDVKEKQAREAAGMPVDVGPISYDDLCVLFLDNYTEASKDWLEQMIGHGRRRFGKLPVRNLRGEQIGKWLHGELADYSPKTRLHILTAMRQVLNAGIEWGYLSRSPASAVRPPKGATKAPEVYPLESWEQVLAVAEQCHHFGPLVRFACATGLRPGEWRALCWHDVDIPNRVMHPPGTKNLGARRPVALSKPALRALAELPRPLDRNAVVFTTPKGYQVDLRNFSRHVWRPALDTLELRRRPPYQMRHSYATLALAQGATIEWISKQMGHANIGITLKFYARFVKAVDDRMLSFLDQMEADAEEATATHQG